MTSVAYLRCLHPTPGACGALTGLVLAALTCLTTAAPPPLASGETRDFDRRVAGPQTRAAVPPERQAALNRLAKRVPSLRADLQREPGRARWVEASDQFLTGPQGLGIGVSATEADRIDTADPHRATKAFLNEHAALFGHDATVLASAPVRRDDTNSRTGLRTVAWQQQLDGIDVFECLLLAHTTRDGELVRLASAIVPDSEHAAAKGTPNRARVLAAPPVSAAQAIAHAVETFGEHDVSPARPVTRPSPSTDKQQFFVSPALSGQTRVRLVWFPLDEDTLRLCWEVVLTTRVTKEMFLVVVDAENGEPLLSRSLTVDLVPASYRVFTSDSPSPLSPGLVVPATNQPPFAARTLVTLSAINTNASPAGWMPDGANETRGNNVDAHTDRTGTNAIDPRPQGSPFRTFDFPLDLATQPPTNCSAAAVVQLFYSCNWMHDKLYELGFTESAGNFQSDNFGRGGLDNDALVAEAQDGAGVNNANFSTPPDGLAPRMQMYLFNGPTPPRDAALDAEMVLHEYTHGMSNRRVGGGIGLSARQSRAMGEGWSDFYALSLLSEPTDDVNGTYAASAYSAHLLRNGGVALTDNYYFGIRRYPYTTEMSRNPLTFKDIDSSQAESHAGIPISPLGFEQYGAGDVHNAGEVWCAILWEVRANLIRRYGHVKGNTTALQLVSDGMTLCPPNPNFVEARDAILQADLVGNAGANRRELWAGFAKRGLGFSAGSPASSTMTGMREAYDLPDELTVAPYAEIRFLGTEGGAVSAGSTNGIVENHGATPLTWTAVCSQSWLEVTPSGGTLAAGRSGQFAVSINAAGRALPAGTYSDTLLFSNVTSGLTQRRPVEWRVVGLADLVTTKVGGPSTAGVGMTIVVTNVVGNVGRDSAVGGYVWFYLSGDATITTNDQSIGSPYGQYIGTLRPGQFVTNTASFVLGSTLVPGTYYFGAIADGANAVTETDESNNAAAGNAVQILGPDLTVPYVAGPATALPGSYVAITNVVRNAGGGLSAGTYMRFYLSPDSMVTTNDTQIGSDYAAYVGSLSPGQSVTNVTSIYVSGVPPGRYTLGAIADVANAIPESNEANNAAAGTAIEVLGPDLVMAAVSGPASATSGVYVAVTGVVQNAGGAGSGGCYLRYYLSVDPSIDPSDLPLGSDQYVGAVAAGQRVTNTASLYIPGSVLNGVYYLGAWADSSNGSAETNEANNGGAGSPVVIAGVGPDLIMGAISGPALADAGATLTVTGVVRNAGASAASPVYAQAYLSTDAVIATNDIALAVVYVGTLAAGQSLTNTWTLSIPPRTPPGPYFIGFMADSFNYVAETNENNNTGVGPVVQVRLPDYAPTFIAGPAAGTTAGTIVLTNTVVNRGPGRGGTVTVGFYLSTDTILDHQDLLLGSRSVSLDAGQTNTAATPLTVGALPGPGTYYLGMIVDPSDACLEADESNNSLLGNPLRLSVGPDLGMTQVTGPGAGRQGGALALTNTIANTGAGPLMAPVSIAFYLSTDGTITTNDIPLLGARSVASLGLGQSSTSISIVTVPANVPPGPYILGAIADPSGAIAETNRANNAVAGNAIVILGPDYVMSQVSGPASAASGGSIVVTNCVMNAGGGGSSSYSYTLLYLSTDALIATNDLLLGYNSVATLTPGQSVTSSVALTIPGTVAPGVYYLGAVADGYNAVVETNESNNTRAGNMITIVGPDLVIDQIDGPASVASGGALTITCVVRNAGLALAGATYNRFYLSTDAVITTNDMALGYGYDQYVGSLAGGQCATGTIALSLAGSVAPGTYYLGAVADAYDYVRESNESNNAAAGNLIQVLGADLTLAMAGGPAQSRLGDAITVTGIVQNIGGAAASSSYLQWYLSADAYADSNDTALGTAQYVSGLAAGQSYTNYASLMIPRALPPGGYYLGAVADSSRSVTETNETNNAIIGNRITLNGPDLVCLGGGGPTNGFVGGYVAMSGTVVNVGPVDAGAFTVGYYLSPDAAITTNDPLLGVRTVSSLHAAESNTATTILYVTNVAAGVYYLGAIADCMAVVGETNEQNNVLVASRLQIRSTGPDLIATAVAGPTNALSGRYVTLTNTVVNRGGVAANDIYVGFYLSTDEAITTNDTFLGARYVPGLESGATNTAGYPVFLGPGLLSGSYFLGAIVDYGRRVMETDETNNSFAGNRIAVTAHVCDLVVGITSSAPFAVLNSAFTYTIAVSNLGTLAASNVVVSDVLPLREVAVMGTAPGVTQQSGASLAWTLPVLAPAAGTQLWVSVRFTNSLPVARFTNAVTATSTSLETNALNNAASIVLLTDHDGDGLPTALEYAGQDVNANGVPAYLDAGETFRMTGVTYGADRLTHVWEAYAGATYQLQACTNLLGSNTWWDVGAPLTAQSPYVSLADTNAAGRQRFYRVVLKALPPGL